MNASKKASIKIPKNASKTASLTELAGTVYRIEENISRVIVGKERQIRLLTLGLCSGLHVLIQDIPGMGKTTLARSLAKSVNMDFARIQFTPDLIPGDIVGMTVWNPEKQSFSYREGAIMHQFILADEINRASPRTQSSLLEAMQEGSVSVEGVTYKLPRPFFLVATRNPENFTGIFPLPEGQLDRFGISFSMGYPTQKEETEILERFKTENPLEVLEPVCDGETILKIRKTVRSIFIKDEVEEYLINIIGKTRTGTTFRYGASPRASQHLLLAAQTNAFLEGRAFVIPEDIRYCAPYVLPHRLKLSAESMTEIGDTRSAVIRIVDSIPIPTSLKAPESK